jgi:hypothetical protein
MKVHAEVQKAEANFESFIRTGVAWTGVVLLATGHPHFNHLPLSPRIEAQGAVISNFMPGTNRVVFDLGAAPNSPEFHDSGPQTAAGVDEDCQTAGLQQRQ